MIQFTLGCILIALTLFFGGKDILSNFEIQGKKQQELAKVLQKRDESEKLQARFFSIERKTMKPADATKEKILEALELDDKEFVLTITDLVKEKALRKTDFVLEGYSDFGGIFKILNTFEAMPGIDLTSICFNCKLKSNTPTKVLDKISFSIKGDIYVYAKQ